MKHACKHDMKIPEIVITIIVWVFVFSVVFD